MNSYGLESADYGVLHHTLGISKPDTTEPYRNHFVAGEGHHDMPRLKRLVEAGLMKQVPAPSFAGQDAMLFIVTEEGKTVAIETQPRPEKLSRSKARYRRYREFGDCFDSFIDFCRWDAEPERSWNQ